jgi:serine O-acetyltransferase
VFQAIKEQIGIIFRRDPAARSVPEIILCYPGFHAILLHRLAHKLWKAGFLLSARIVAQVSRSLTGIEIHPGAQIGQRFFIDHGMGVVIGETAEIGDDVLLYQGVTLGGTGKEKGKRHPTIGSNVVIGTGAKVLGNIRIGNHVKIGAGSVVVHSVPEYCTVVGPGAEVNNVLEHGKLPDPQQQAIDRMNRRIAELETKMQILAGQKGVQAIDMAQVIATRGRD